MRKLYASKQSNWSPSVASQTKATKTSWSKKVGVETETEMHSLPLCPGLGLRSPALSCHTRQLLFGLASTRPALPRFSNSARDMRRQKLRVSRLSQAQSPWPSGTRPSQACPRLISPTQARLRGSERNVRRRSSELQKYPATTTGNKPGGQRICSGQRLLWLLAHNTTQQPTDLLHPSIHPSIHPSLCR